ncbi:hypothetical protein WK80_27625 [Burkholderia multivorans]|uniref:hypothetical protein n=1 Tax=Burkholderia multivorans TaxID=87883 RepID=UPI000757D135|nr:hypothetical protein [Burkholderia multivorans]KVV18716.1 hypothetical protein WK80_27625 [Burkholderia multivorans]MCA8389004.1 hypothetical protein [Burkholderia multivorans]MCO8319823.1 hypothetical protein [Burkholderia multivorans]MCO8430743.1 hypothetical protein [Burkholderia multivorans]MCO8441639.1 hypothetical protein [Burkholderia multivorans]
MNGRLFFGAMPARRRGIGRWASLRRAVPCRLVDAHIDRLEGHATIGKGGAPSPPENLATNLPRPVCATTGRSV